MALHALTSDATRWVNTMSQLDAVHQRGDLTPPPRQVTSRYRDPLEVLWLACAARLGWRVIRSGEVFASWDGERILTLGRDADLDDDDHCAQMVLHEICHALIEGPRGWRLVDWGLSNFNAQDLDRELGCLRLQAYWASSVRLRGFFAATTDWRAYYDLIPIDPLRSLNTSELMSWCEMWGLDLESARGLDERATALAQVGLRRASELDWTPHLQCALEGTAALAQIVAPHIHQLDVSEASEARDLWSVD